MKLYTLLAVSQSRFSGKRTRRTQTQFCRNIGRITVHFHDSIRMRSAVNRTGVYMNRTLDHPF